jgi:hypothetical protein
MQSLPNGTRARTLLTHRFEEFEFLIEHIWPL